MVSERVAYLRGLLKGMEMDSNPREGRLWTAVLETLDELAATVADLQQRNEDLADELDELYEEFSALEEGWLEQLPEDVDLTPYQVICPTCGYAIFMGDDLLLEGSTICPSCGEELEFDLTDLSEEERPPQMLNPDGE